MYPDRIERRRETTGSERSEGEGVGGTGDVKGGFRVMQECRGWGQEWSGDWPGGSWRGREHMGWVSCRLECELFMWGQVYHARRVRGCRRQRRNFRSGQENIWEDSGRFWESPYSLGQTLEPFICFQKLVCIYDVAFWFP